MMTKQFVVVVLACLCGVSAAKAQSYPTRTITLTVTAAAGGVTDVVARAVGQRLADSWGQQVVIENKGGAAHVVGAQSVAKAAPDGHSLLVAEAGTFTVNPTLYGKGKLPYDEERDFVPVTGLVRINQALLGHPSVPANSVSELIECQAEAGGVHLRDRRHRLRPAHEHGAVREPGRGQAAAGPLSRCGTGLTDVIAGHVKLMSVSVSLALPPLRAGQIRVFGIGSANRLAGAADIATVAESGLPGYEATTWFGLFAPAGTPRDIVMKINGEIRKSWPMRNSARNSWRRKCSSRWQGRRKSSPNSSRCRPGNGPR